MRLSTPRFAVGLALVLTVLAVIVSFSVVGAKPVYLDDLLTDNSTLDRVDDVAAAFRRTSLDHQAGAGAGAVDIQAVSYRPITMATLAATQVAAGSLKAHHIVSLILHVLTALLVALAVRRSGRPDWLSSLHVSSWRIPSPSRRGCG